MDVFASVLAASVLPATIILISWAILKPILPNGRTLWAWTSEAPLPAVYALIGVTLVAHACGGLLISALIPEADFLAALFGVFIWTVLPGLSLALHLLSWPSRKAQLCSPELLRMTVVTVIVALLYNIIVLVGLWQSAMWPDLQTSLLLIVGTVLTAGGEEIVFRVFLTTALYQHSRSLMIALIGSAFIFSGAHAILEMLYPIISAEPGAVWNALIGYTPLFLWQTAMGGVLAALWLRTGSVMLVISTHALVNLGRTLVQGF